ncbi:MarR family winged helix-turn-helix transcriptional regulator [Mycobacterium sp. MYCO198283]|uniref:MarR family winged helix-turn-helix transcriptional regulator n=1 Tax=Mycobacterium sp. MYCO198283 TaxID=2883505 RepID=UPI001E4B54A8|nr:MarR family winged helix-turn-helix transcriptional regulator [Mycobacterium sp. MYCO198283]MCG5432249.1 MarR family winged helix-turn-helix transcriptional regulator [Mycobacterium sp. MYCO198283]
MESIDAAGNDLLDLGRLMTRASRLYAAAADQALAPLGLRHAYIPVLALLRDGQGMTQTALAHSAGMEQPSMAQLLSRMRRDGLVSVSSDRADARRRIIELTPAALTVLADARGRLVELQHRALTEISPADAAVLGRVLAQLISNLATHSGIELDGELPLRPPTAQ